MAVHPAGHFFAVGYTDGLIGFWAVADDKQPLLFKTNTESDVQDDPNQSFWLSENVQILNLGPVYKLIWCGFPDSAWGGDTALLVLGGSSSAKNRDLAVHLLPAFNPTTEKSSPLNQIIRDVMIQTFTSKKVYFYSTSTVLSDVHVVPRSSPHFSGTWDPVALIFVCRTSSGARNLEAYEFPPKHFFDIGPTSLVSVSSGVDIVDHLDDLLEEMKLDLGQERLRLPSALRGEADEVISVHTVPIKREVMDSLSHTSMTGNVLALRGGAAWIDSTSLVQVESVKVCNYKWDYRWALPSGGNLSVFIERIPTTSDNSPS